jgi:hypothetical protein
MFITHRAEANTCARAEVVVRQGWSILRWGALTGCKTAFEGNGDITVILEDGGHPDLICVSSDEHSFKNVQISRTLQLVRTFHRFW